MKDKKVEGLGLRTEKMTINMGPQHPATHGVLRLVLTLDGEVVVGAVPYVGYLHRGIEKIAENKTLHQVIPYTEDGLSFPNFQQYWIMPCS